MQSCSSRHDKLLHFGEELVCRLKRVGGYALTCSLSSDGHGAKARAKWMVYITGSTLLVKASGLDTPEFHAPDITVGRSLHGAKAGYLLSNF